MWKVKVGSSGHDLVLVSIWVTTLRATWKAQALMRMGLPFLQSSAIHFMTWWTSSSLMPCCEVSCALLNSPLIQNFRICCHSSVFTAVIQSMKLSAMISKLYVLGRAKKILSFVRNTSLATAAVDTTMHRWHPVQNLTVSPLQHWCMICKTVSLLFQVGKMISDSSSPTGKNKGRTRYTDSFHVAIHIALSASLLICIHLL